VNLQKAPFPWFGGKSQAAEAVWAALGDVEHYVEPFAGSLAVLLNRPHEANRTYFSETVNDLDGLLVNAWRAIQLDPEETAFHASNPVAEADMHARHVALIRWREERELEHLMGDPEYHDARMAGWWLWGVSCWIGSGWCSGQGPWWPDESGRLSKRAEAGVSRQLPHLTSDGQGVNHAGLREAGVSRQLPHLTSDGGGVNRPQMREEGVTRKLPHLTSDGRGVNHAGLREEGDEYHDVVMPRLREWFAWLSARLRHVRILNGDWARTVTTGASLTLPVRMGGGVCGVFLDPPYGDAAGRDMDLYAHDSGTLAGDVAKWALANGGDVRYHIVVAGFVGEHGAGFEQAGWREVEWFKAGFLRGGMGNLSGGDSHQQGRERLWLSPHCLEAEPVVRSQMGLWE